MRLDVNGVIVRRGMAHEGLQPELRWEDVRPDWEPDGSELRDIYVFETSVDDWQRVCDLVARRWPHMYSLNSVPQPMPSSVQVVWESQDTSPSLTVEPREGLVINSGFFGEGTIEFDVSPHDVVGQPEFDAVCEFVRAIGATLRKTVLVCYEGMPIEEEALERAIMRYDPETDELVRVPPPEPIPLLERLGRPLDSR